MRRRVGNYIFIIGLLIVLILNLSNYELFQKVYPYNYHIIAIIETLVFICYFEPSNFFGNGFKGLFRDKLFWVMVLANVITVVNLLCFYVFFRTALIVYSLTMYLYLADKVMFNKTQEKAIILTISFFFVFWNLNMMGLFHGYTINFGGQVLIGGFVFLIIIFKKLKFWIIYGNHRDFFVLSKYPWLVTGLDCLLFAWGFYIIAHYRCRTSLVSLSIFAILLIIPKKVIYKKPVKYTITTLSFLNMVVFPYLYIKLKILGVFDNTTIFDKQLVSDRANVWAFIKDLIAVHPIVGHGTVYINEGTAFRVGLLDTSNTFLQLAVPHGLIVTVIVFCMLIFVFCRQISNIGCKPLGHTLFAALITYNAVSTSESFLITAPFMMIYASLLFVVNMECGTKKFNCLKSDE